MCATREKDLPSHEPSPHQAIAWNRDVSLTPRPRGEPEYLARKQAEGKTNKGALRSLKRHLARHFHRLLAEPLADQSTPIDGQPIIEPRQISIPQLPAIPPPSPRQRPADANTNGQAPSRMACVR